MAVYQDIASEAEVLSDYFSRTGEQYGIFDVVSVKAISEEIPGEVDEDGEPAVRVGPEVVLRYDLQRLDDMDAAYSSAKAFAKALGESRDVILKHLEQDGKTERQAAFKAQANAAIVWMTKQYQDVALYRSPSGGDGKDGLLILEIAEADGVGSSFYYWKDGLESVTL
ncbi:hypothetical protein ACIQVA_37830 [Streptomyces microflavus]|uniref:hypothetical protein n=1 Tax=Streptomyces microflavus TaxID=1919 RepID=UPI00381C81A2